MLSSFRRGRPMRVRVKCYPKLRGTFRLVFFCGDPTIVSPRKGDIR